MSEVVHTNGSHEGRSDLSYGAAGRTSTQSGLSWRAGVFLLAGALVVLSAMFGSNDDSSAPTTGDSVIWSQR